MAIIKETKVRTFTVNGITITIAARDKDGADALDTLLTRIAIAFWQSGDDAEHNGYVHTAAAEREVAHALHEIGEALNLRNSVNETSEKENDNG